MCIRDSKYYLDNFNYLIDFVQQHYSHLFTNEEHQFFHVYSRLTENAQQLFVRLVLRTHAYLRLSKINYAELEIPQALKELGKCGFINTDEDRVEHCLHLFTHTELSHALGQPFTNNTEIDLAAWKTPDLFGDSPIARLMANDCLLYTSPSPRDRG